MIPAIGAAAFAAAAGAAEARGLGVSGWFTGGRVFHQPATRGVSGPLFARPHSDNDEASRWRHPGGDGSSEQDGRLGSREPCRYWRCGPKGAQHQVIPPPPPRFTETRPPRSWNGLPSARPHAVSPPPAPPPPATAAQPSIARGLPPPAGERRYRRGQVLVETSDSLPPTEVAVILARHKLVETHVDRVSLLGTTLREWRFARTREVATVVRELGGEAALLRVQPNYVYRLSQQAASLAPTTASTPEQYALGRLHVDASLDAPRGERVRVALIDTGVDATHPDLAGAVESNYDALDGEPSDGAASHGTAIAGAIAAHGLVRGIAPSVRILSARAFDAEGGTTESIVTAIDWAARSGARIINMSFTGPDDPGFLHSALAAAYASGDILVGAAGNDGPDAKPLYPAADNYVLAVTATDAQDKLFDMASTGAYVSIAAPGVEVFLPASDAGYTVETGTSVSAALVSGLLALMLERRPKAAPAQLRNWLVTSATPLPDRQSLKTPVGLADARAAISAVEADRSGQ